MRRPPSRPCETSHSRKARGRADVPEHMRRYLQPTVIQLEPLGRPSPRPQRRGSAPEREVCSARVARSRPRLRAARAIEGEGARGEARGRGQPWRVALRRGGAYRVCGPYARQTRQALCGWRAAAPGGAPKPPARPRAPGHELRRAQQDKGAGVRLRARRASPRRRARRHPRPPDPARRARADRRAAGRVVRGARDRAAGRRARQRRALPPDRRPRRRGARRASASCAAPSRATRSCASRARSRRPARRLLA